jgi:protein arginine N-methyltransferase 1
MFADKLRMDAYSAAIARCVRPGDAVVDLGCGPGVFALLACKAGARRVYAIDLDSVVDFGRQLAAANGFSDQVIFMRGDSRQIHLPERANVIVADVRGVVPLSSHAVDTLEDARDRFLAPGGHLIPSCDTLYAAVVELPTQYATMSQAWRSVPQLDLSSGLPLVLNTIYCQQIKPYQLLSEARPWHVLDYVSSAGQSAHALLHLPITRNATGHGIAVWFSTQLADGIGFSTEPQSGENIYGHVFLPWLEPLSLCQGEICSIELRAQLVGNDYVWQWETSLPNVAARKQVRFVQSSFHGSLFPPSMLRKRATGYVPVLSEAGLAERWILQAMDGKRALQDIAAEAARLFPHIFRRADDAFGLAAEIAEKFSR